MNAFDHLPPTKITLDEPEEYPKLVIRSLMLLVIAFTMVQGSQELFSHFPDSGRTFQGGYICVFLLLTVAALIGSVLALVRHHHDEGVKLPAGCALLGSMVMLASFNASLTASSERIQEASRNAPNLQEKFQAPPPAPPARPAPVGRRAEIEKNVATIDQLAASTATPLSADERIARLNAAAGNMTGLEGQIMAAVKPVMTELEEGRRAKYQHQLDLRKVGALAFTNLKTQEDILSRRALLQGYVDECQRFVKLQRTLNDRLAQALKAAGLSEDNIRTFFVGWNRTYGVQGPLHLKSDECELRGCQDVLGVFDLLEQERGEWRLDADGKLTFNRQAAQTKFLALAEDAQRARQEMFEAQKESEALHALKVPEPRR